MACPRCGKNQKLYIRRMDGRFCCFVCREIESFQGRPEFALTELCNLSLDEVRLALYDTEKGKPTSIYLDIDINDFEDADSPDYINIKPELQTFEWPRNFHPLDHELSSRGVKYLESRGIPVTLAMEYGIRYNPDKVSVVFPVLSKGKLYGWQSRLVEGDKPYWSHKYQKMVKPIKALTHTDLKKDQTLMFADRLENSQHCVLTEGPVDAIKAHLAGGNVCTLGKSVSRAQLELLRVAGIQKIYLGLDPDAYEEVNRIRKEIRNVVFYDLRPPAPYGDLGAMPLEAVKEAFDRAPILTAAQIVIYLKNHYGAC